MAKRILIKPIITEKAESLSEKKGQYVFMVDKGANKIEIRQSIESIYNVTVDSVNTMIVPGKKKVRSTKNGVSRGMKPSYKKAVVTLAKGETLDIFGEA